MLHSDAHLQPDSSMEWEEQKLGRNLSSSFGFMQISQVLPWDCYSLKTTKCCLLLDSFQVFCNRKWPLWSKTEPIVQLSTGVVRWNPGARREVFANQEARLTVCAMSLRHPPCFRTRIPTLWSQYLLLPQQFWCSVWLFIQAGYLGLWNMILEGYIELSGPWEQGTLGCKSIFSLQKLQLLNITRWRVAPLWDNLQRLPC